MRIKLNHTSALSATLASLLLMPGVALAQVGLPQPNDVPSPTDTPAQAAEGAPAAGESP